MQTAIGAGSGRITAVLGIVFSLACGGEPDATSESVEVAPQPAAASTPIVPPAAAADRPGLSFPYLVEDACPGEGCSYGAWLACDSVTLFAAPGSGAVVGSLAAGESFEVTTGTVLVDSPTVVVATEPTRQVPYATDALTFQPGDTILVLNYLGEGFFGASYRDSIIEVEAFWPWNEFATADDGYTGELVSRGGSGFWVRTATPAGEDGWVWTDVSSIAAPNALDPDPATCRLP